MPGLSCLSSSMDKLHVDVIPPPPRQRLKYLRNSSDLRRSTYAKYKSSSKVVEEDDLVHDGFFYVGDGKDDMVQCSYCGGILSGFQEGDDVHKEHYRHFPECERFLMRDECYNSLFEISNDNDDSDDLEIDGEKTDVTVADYTQYDGHGLAPVFRPRHKYYSWYEDRIRSFKAWPKGKLPLPEDIARAGMFFTGKDDCCECFYCGGQLDQWEEEDKPQEEHDNNFKDICPIAKRNEHCTIMTSYTCDRKTL